ncbi:MAG: hypothetical protein ACK4M9_12160 [Anaerobacillus sp.]|uniref:hypothetical protein n=1 Tax=Anaerobacillus sp. TaxID=1872506 RepID=UPI00391A2DA4
MNKLDYLLETSRGQLSRYYERWCNRITIDVPMEPKSKNSIDSAEETLFQQFVLEKLKNENRRGFLGPIAIEFDFYPTENNPPHIHKLPKNYLDLLSQPVNGSNIRRKNLLFQDDRQVQILIVNYHIEQRNEKPRISINAVGMSNILEDLKLLDKINSNSFKYDEEYRGYEFDELLKDEDSRLSIQRRLDEAIENYYSTKEMEEYYRKHNEKQAYETMLGINLYHIQNHLFSIDKISPIDLFNFYPKLVRERYKVLAQNRITNLLELSRSLVISPIFSPLDLLTLPTQKGETKVFKEKVRESLIHFKKKYKFISSLLINVSLTILYVPPKYQEIDLDNLARYIVPQVNEELKPSSKIFYAQEDIKGFTHSSITQYQVIRVPRLETDPEEGIVRFVINKKEPYSSILKELDHILSRWSDSI